MTVEPKPRTTHKCAWLSGCDHPVKQLHPVFGVFVCGRHAKGVHLEQFARYDHMAQEHDSGSLRQIAVRPRPPWRTRDETPSPVIIKNPVKWCAKCGAAIENKFTYCQLCFSELPAAEKTEQMTGWRRAAAQRFRRGRA